MSRNDEHDRMVEKNVSRMHQDASFKDRNQQYLEFMLSYKFQYNYSWFGRPIIQIPQDIYAVQEMIWTAKPELIIETGIAHGGSLILSASLLAQLDMLDGLSNFEENQKISFSKKRHVIGIDIEIRSHNKISLKNHPMAPYYTMFEGSSTDTSIIDKVREFASRYEKVMVLLDSNHTHEHVLNELKAYAPLVSKGSYLVVWDSGLEDVSDATNEIIKSQRPWGIGNNPKTALIEYLNEVDPYRTKYELDTSLRTKIGISATSDSFLVRRED